eukprot:scaffold188506_cov18-Tisochrysis_lutea.AAC.3
MLTSQPVPSMVLTGVVRLAQFHSQRTGKGNREKATLQGVWSKAESLDQCHSGHVDSLLDFHQSPALNRAPGSA